MTTARLSPDAMVVRFLDRYRKTKALHPVVAEMYDAPEFEHMFWACLTHDLHVIRCRSNVVGDGEITAAQRAFCILMDKKSDGFAAIELYVNELIGLNYVSETDRAQTIATALQTKDFILSQSHIAKDHSLVTNPQASTLPTAANPRDTHSSDHSRCSNIQPPDKDELLASDCSESFPCSQYPYPKTKDRGIPAKNEVLDGSFQGSKATSNADKMFEKLVATYQHAKRDFEVRPKRSMERTKSAKFLRDTTENCLTYLNTLEETARGRMPTTSHNEMTLNFEETLDEMESTLQEAIEAAEEGSGGKKRRFDEDWTDIPSAPATMRSALPKKPLIFHTPQSRTLQPSREIIRSSRPKKEDWPRLSLARLRRQTRIDQMPRNLVPASSGKGVRRVFPRPTHIQDQRSPDMGPSRPHTDRYRPKYN